MTRFALAVPHWGPFGDPRSAVDLAQRAESAGWHAYFTWGGFVVRDDPPPTHDPWVVLAAVATATTDIRIGTCIVPIHAYRPHVVASIVASLDVLSGGRMTLGVGLGDSARAFGAFGQPSEPVERAALLDEALDVITQLWSGERVVHRGRHYVVDGFTLASRPIQRPRVPIWVGGDSPAAKRRAARWDGWIGPDDDPASATPADLQRVRDELTSFGAPADGHTVAWAGKRNAAVEWAVIPALGSVEDVSTLVDAGPPDADAAPA